MQQDREKTEARKKHLEDWLSALKKDIDSRQINITKLLETMMPSSLKEAGATQNLTSITNHIITAEVNRDEFEKEKEKLFKK